MPQNAVTGQKCRCVELQNHLGWKGCLDTSRTTCCSEQGQLCMSPGLAAPQPPRACDLGLFLAQGHLCPLTVLVCARSLMSIPACLQEPHSLLCSLCEAAAVAARCPLCQLSSRLKKPSLLCVPLYTICCSPQIFWWIE